MVIARAPAQRVAPPLTRPVARAPAHAPLPSFWKYSASWCAPLTSFWVFQGVQTQVHEPTNVINRVFQQPIPTAPTPSFPYPIQGM
jgi:hypothetical protein